MRKIRWFTAVAVSVACVGAWIIPAPQAGLDMAGDARIDPMRIMADARDLPVEIVVDLSTLD
jgi:hypothetical protein